MEVSFDISTIYNDGPDKIYPTTGNICMGQNSKGLGSLKNAYTCNDARLRAKTHRDTHIKILF